MLDARKKEGKIVSLSFTFFASPSFFFFCLTPAVWWITKEFQSVVMEQRQTQQLLQEASASLKRFYVKEAHSWWWDDGCTWVKGSEVKLRVSRCHHLRATTVGGGFYFYFFFIFNHWGNDKIWEADFSNGLVGEPTTELGFTFRITFALLPSFTWQHHFQLWKAPAFIQAKKSKAGEPEFKDSEWLWDLCFLQFFIQMPPSNIMIVSKMHKANFGK